MTRATVANRTIAGVLRRRLKSVADDRRPAPFDHAFPDELLHECA